jgi:hypothetical protein
MVNGGLAGPSGRRERRVERALSASAAAPTVAFVALGTVTILLVALLGMSPLGSFRGPSAHDGGWAVTTPRMSVSMVPPFVHRSAPHRDRETAQVGGPPAVIAEAVDGNTRVDLVETTSFDSPGTPPAKNAVVPAPLPVPPLAPVPAPAPAPVPAPAPSPERAPAPERASSPERAPERVPDRVAGSDARQESDGSDTRHSGVEQPFSQASAFTEQRVVTGDDRADDGSRHAAKRRGSTDSAKPERAAKGSKPDRESPEDRAFRGHRTAWRM